MTTTTTTTTTYKVKIALSDSAPVRVVKEEWPVIADASDYDNQHECQANHVWWIKVRQHADGRRIVYGRLEAGPGGVSVNWRGAHAGYLVDASDSDAETVRAIRRVAGVIQDEKMGDDCIADLPARDL